MFESEWPLFVRVTLNTSGIGAGCESRLFQFKATVRVVAIATLHQAFEYFVMKRKIELMFGLTVTTHAELRLTRPQQSERREARLLRICFAHEYIRTCEVSSGLKRMS